MQRIRQAGRFFLTGDRLLVTLFALLVLYYGVETLSFFRTMSEDVVGPASFPRLLAVFGGILVVLFFIQKRRERPDADAEPHGARMAQEAVDLIPVGLMLAYVLLIEPLGFLISTFLFVAATMRFLGQGWKGAFGYSLAMTVTVFMLFYYGLLAQIPMGSWVKTEELLPFLVDIRRAIGG